MKLDIIKKEDARNNMYKPNGVYFTVDGVQLKLDIVYIKTNENKFNAFYDGPYYKNVKNYINKNYNINWNDFCTYFMYKLYKYSRGINLDFEYIQITDDIIKEMEEAKCLI